MLGTTLHKHPIGLGEIDRLYLRYIVFGANFSTQPVGIATASLPAFVVSLLTSPQFWIEVGQPAFQGSLQMTGDEVLPDSIAKWATNRLNVKVGAGGRRLDLLADLIQADFLADDLALVEAPWSAAGLSAVLRRILEPSDVGTNFLPHLRQIARGVVVLDAVDMDDGKGLCGVGLRSDHASILFALDCTCPAPSPFWRLDFGFRGGEDYANGTLHLIYEYAPESAVKVPLVPQGRSHYAAYVAASGLKTIRWAPADAEGPAVLTMLTARPQPVETIIQDLLQTEGTVALDHLFKRFGPRFEAKSPALLGDLSGVLTRSLGGHVFTERSYRTWIRRHELHGQEAKVTFQAQMNSLSKRPKISVVINLDDGQPAHSTETRLADTLSALAAQFYEDWELIVVEQTALLSESAAAIGRSVQGHPVKHVLTSPDADRAIELNLMLNQAQGEWLIVLNAGDRLSSNAFLALVSAASRHAAADLVYADDDGLDDAGGRIDPHFKPDFSPTLLLAMNYIGDSPLLRVSTVKKLGGWRDGFGGHAHYDLIWRMADICGPDAVIHVPELLRHRRWTPNEDRKAADQDQLAAAGIRLLEDHLVRRKEKAAVTALGPDRFRVRYALPSPPPLVSLVIPTRDQSRLLEQCVVSILDKSTYKNLEIIIADNDSVEPETFSLLKDLQQRSNVFVLPCPGEFNYAHINNTAVKATRGEIIGLVNNDIEVITPDWIEEMTSWALRPEVGCVGAKLYYAEDIVQHAGVILGIGGVGAHSHKYSERGEDGYFSRLKVHQDLSAVTAACLFVKRSIFEDVGGLDEIFKVTFNDVDFCLRVRERGYRNLFTPFAELYHHEGQSRGADDTSEKSARFLHEIQLMKDRWGEILTTDPYYSPNLTLTKEDFDLRWMGD